MIRRSFLLCTVFTFILLMLPADFYPAEQGTRGTVEDIDGNRYDTVIIAGREWMAENLKVTRFRNGDEIPEVKDKPEWAGLSTGARCAYDNDESNVSVYGFLYNWYAISDSRGLAPEGWHIPTDEEWKELENYLGMSQSEADEISWRGVDAGGKLKETGTSHWNSPNTGATNETGFTALAGGYRVSNGMFIEFGNSGTFWSSSEYDNATAWSRNPYFSKTSIYRYNYAKKRGFSVRCIRDK